jgi:hypothetical protein
LLKAKTIIEVTTCKQVISSKFIIFCSFRQIDCNTKIVRKAKTRSELTFCDILISSKFKIFCRLNLINSVSLK